MFGNQSIYLLSSKLIKLTELGVEMIPFPDKQQAVGQITKSDNLSVPDPDLYTIQS